MFLLGPLLLLVVSVVWAEERYFPQSNATTWEEARLYCQVCFTELATITPENVLTIAKNLSLDYWIGLRKNVSGPIPWSRWSNGAPVTYQNWYPGHPIPKKEEIPVPTCPPPTVLPVNETVQCPTLAKLLACLNTTEDPHDPFINSTISPDNHTYATHDTFTTAPVTMIPTTITSLTSLPAISTTPSDTDSDYIEDSCVALLSFGMWWEKHCYEHLPFICYDEQFFGDISIFNVTHNEASLNWTAPLEGEISHYRVELRNKSSVIRTFPNETGLRKHIVDLVPGTFYAIQVFPVKCGRDLNPQNVSFYTLPNEIEDLHIVEVKMEEITLKWSIPEGGHESYLITISQKPDETSYTENYTIKNLLPGELYKFTVRSMLNMSLLGYPKEIEAYTKPSPILNLTAANNESHSVYAWWISHDRNNSTYSYNVLLNMNWSVCIMFKPSVKLESLQPGTKYSLRVSALVNGTVEGDAVTIDSYTLPETVTDLRLSSTESLINATWMAPNGSYSSFNVTLSDSTKVTLAYRSTTDLKVSFSGLNAAKLYNVSVFTVVKEDLPQSKPANASIYTLPNPPRNARTIAINKSTIQVLWDVPLGSEGVLDINYMITYSAPFWNSNGSNSVIGNKSLIITGLNSGTKYNFNVSVQAGNSTSLPATTSNMTFPQNKTLMLTMLCSSATNLLCMQKNTSGDILYELTEYFNKNFQDNIVWSIKMKE